VLFPFCKLVSGRACEVKPGLWVLVAISLLFFVFYMIVRWLGIDGCRATFVRDGV
jgi:hypothetical protein